MTNTDPVAQRRRAQLSRVADELRTLHKALMEEARADYERTEGPIASAPAFLQLLMTDPSFRWLRHLSSAMADLDELLDLPEILPEHARAVRVRFEMLVTDEESEFGVRYREYMQRKAEVIMAHAAVRIALRPL